VAVTQSHYRFGIDELAENTHGWHAAEDVQANLPVGTTFLLRICLQCDATLQSNIDAEFQVRKNGGAYQNITTTSSIVLALATAVFTNGQNTTQRLSGTGTFEASSAGCTEDGISGGTTFDIVASGNGETECAMQIVGADVQGGDLLEFRLTRDGGVLLDTYAVTPSILVNDAVSLTAGAPTVTVSAPAVSVLAAATLAAGAPVVTISAPTATLSTGDQILAAGAAVVTVSAPTVTVLAETAVVAGAATVTISAPTVTLLAETSMLLGAPTITVMAPAVTLVADQFLAAGAPISTVSAPAAILVLAGGGGEILGRYRWRYRL
jgi:hypothetical protein